MVEYDPSWPETFQRLRDQIASALGDLAVRIEHVGSTAVPGLAAKPIVDMDVVVASRAEVPAAIERLAPLGYLHQGDMGIAGREAFLAPWDAPRHHLYLCASDNVQLQLHLQLRNYLRTHPAAAQEYAALKRTLAERYEHDREAYTEAKTAMVEDLLGRAADEAGP